MSGSSHLLPTIETGRVADDLRNPTSALAVRKGSYGTPSLALPVKYYPCFCRSVAAGLLWAVLGVPALAQEYNVTQQTLTVPVVDSKTHPVHLDALGQPQTPQPVSYILLTHNEPLRPDEHPNTLLICLHGAGDPAENFAPLWLPLMRSHAKLVVAVPEINLFWWGSDQIAAIVADTVAKNHVNPRHVVLVGTSLGAGQALVIVQEHPEFFAGYGSLSGPGIMPFFAPTMLQYRNTLALYENNGDGEGAKPAEMSFMAATLRYYGFSHVLAEVSHRSHNIMYKPFEPDTKRMMAFFDAAILDRDKQVLTVPMSSPAEASSSPSPKVTAPPKTALVPPANVILRRLTVTGHPTTGYLLLSPDPAKIPASTGATLLLCLYGPGDQGSDFAKNWFGLVGSRSDVVVAVPTVSVAPGSASGAVPKLAMIKGIIDDTVARDHVNPRRVILVGHDWGGQAAAIILGAHPDLFAGYAAFSTSLPGPFEWQGLQYWQKMPVYYAVGAKDEMFGDVYRANLDRFREAGFTHLLGEAAPAGHSLTQDEIKHMMDFFDSELAIQDKNAVLPIAAAK